jgi:NADH-quinone oxidoreductase subunit A
MPEGTVWPLAVFATAAIVLVAGVLAASHWLGERHHERATGDPFESGVVPVHRARFRIQAKFYIVAVLFVIFDIEAVFIVTWAVIARDAGWVPFIEIAIFITVLIAALAYLWRVGALDWAPAARRGPARHRAPRRKAPPRVSIAATRPSGRPADIGNEA